MIAQSLILLFLQMPAATIDSAVRASIEAGVFPGAVVTIGDSRGTFFERGYGHFSWDESSPVPSPETTLFDLASLTKVVATTPAVMVLVDRGLLSLETPVQSILREFSGDGKEAVVVRHLLEHTSGLRSFLSLPDLAESPEEARALVMSEPLRYRPGSRVVYSDLNAMLLGWIVEAVSGEPLDEFVLREVHAPAGMTLTRFRPGRELRDRIMPVGLWRGHVIAGELHDQNAVILGGVSGHAGLYSTGRDLARYARLLLNEGQVGDRRIFSSETVSLFTRRHNGERALGWEMRDTTGAANSGTLMSAAAFGHGGYTGTSIWIDPQLDLYVVILTNRVFAPRTRRSITQLKEMRGVVADGAVRLGRACSAAGATC